MYDVKLNFSKEEMFRVKANDRNEAIGEALDITDKMDFGDLGVVHISLVSAEKSKQG